jgi:septal ring factor EnvC (AmiA/AmiB activator)
MSAEQTEAQTEQQRKTAAKIRQLHSTIDILRHQRDRLHRELGERTKERDLARSALREFEEADTLPFPKHADHDTPEGKLFASEAAAWAGLEAEDAKTLPQHVSGKVANA